jgi:hypothetical protein
MLLHSNPPVSLDEAKQEMRRKFEFHENKARKLRDYETEPWSGVTSRTAREAKEAAEVFYNL